jgi:outer membrane protein OmpA-like peptidoglycan-associated protein
MKIVSCFLIFLLLAGCASQSTSPSSSPVPISADCQKQKLIERLKKGGVQVIQVGDEWRFILPMQRFFFKNRPVLLAAAYPTLNNLIALLNQQKNFGINVLAYTITLDDFKPNMGLAQQQAQALVDYFLQQGLNTRLITASAWKGTSERQKQGTGRFSDDAPDLFSVEVRARLLHPEDSQ